MSLVRGRTLVWMYAGSACIEANSAFGTYCIWIPEHGSPEWKLSKVGNWTAVESIEAAKVTCQADHDRRVLAEIEVVPLVFKESETLGLVLNAERATVEGRDYTITTDDKVSWYVAQINPSGVEYPSRQDAIAACNEHNRRMILGEHGIQKGGA